MKATYDFTVTAHKVYGAWVTSFSPPITPDTPDDIVIAIMHGQRMVREGAMKCANP